MMSVSRLTFSLAAVCMLTVSQADAVDPLVPVAPDRPAEMQERPDDLIGAASVIRAARDAAEQANQPGEDARQVGEPWAAGLERFKRTRLSLDPDAAAAQWLALLEQGFASQDVWDVFSQSATALPGPDAWPHLVKAIEARPIPERGLRARRELCLRILVGTLVNDPARVAESLEAIEKMTQGRDAGDSESLRRLQAAIARERLDAAPVSEASIRRAITAAVEMFAEWGEVETMRVPDLAGALEEKDAEALLIELLRAPIFLTFEDSGEPTITMARRLMMKHIDELAVPQWSLVGGENVIAYYELLASRFDVDKPAGPWQQRRRSSLPWDMREARQQADEDYVMALIQQGMEDKARQALLARFTDTDQASYYGNEFDTKAIQQGIGDELWAIVESVMDQIDVPSDEAWHAYCDLGLSLGKTTPVIERLQAALIETSPWIDKQPERWTMLSTQCVEALLAEGQLEQAVETLRSAITGLEAAERFGRVHVGLGETLAGLGFVMDKPAWVDAGIAWVARKEHGGGYDDTLAELYEKDGRLIDAEQWRQTQLIEAIKLEAAADAHARHRFNDFDRQGTPGAALIELAKFYHRMGRHGDVLLLIEDAPYWPVQDLAMMMEGYSAQTEFAIAVAAALADAGRFAEARPIVRAAIDLEPDFDPAYALLVAIEGEAALDILDSLYDRDRFEERPLIWKAHLLNQLGRHAQAANIAKQAIAVDPSDGDQGKGDRMRVYAVLADALAGLGEVEDAAFYREVVASIRMSEHADDLFRIGLTGRAAEKYKQALTRFADAYCIQSRLAIRLHRMGRHDEAAEHYRRAFELMPDSFGRVESHCFGCEGVFHEGIAQDIADEVFTELLKQNPERPQLHYLVGYLRSSQDREAEAMRHYQRAVELDPDYVNAWRKLAYATNGQQLAPEQRDAIVFNQLRLDPLGRHGSANTRAVYDLAGLWSAVEKSIALQPAVPEKLFVLPTPPKPDLDEVDPHLAQALIWHQQFQQSRLHDRNPADPADVIAEHLVVQALDAMLMRN